MKTKDQPPTPAADSVESNGSLRRRIHAGIYDRDFFLSPVLEGYDEFRAGRLSLVKARQLQMLAIERGIRLLEVGFGRGEFLLHCARAGASVAGVDYAEAALEIGRQTLRDIPGADLRQADARHLPFPDSTFDRAYAGDVIEHLCYADAIEMLAEMYRVTRPGGFLLVKTTPNTVFVRWIYPWARVLLRWIDATGVAQMDQQLALMRQVHVDEYSVPGLRTAARQAQLPSPQVWVDPDIFRSGGYKYSERYKTNGLLRLVGRLGRLWPMPLLLGNDLYLKCTKPMGATSEARAVEPPVEASRHTSNGQGRKRSN